MVTREHYILALIGHGGFASQRGQDVDFESDLVIVRSLEARGLIFVPSYHTESTTAKGDVDQVYVARLTDAGREYLEHLKRGIRPSTK